MLLRGLAALLALALPTAASPVIVAPVDQVARVKFPRSDPDLVDMLADINRRVNTQIKYVSDQKHYGRDEQWVMLPPDGKGDCEDFALSKMELARRNGFPTTLNARIRGVLVHEGKETGGHAVLELKLPDGAVMFLDNRSNEPMTRSELERAGYQFADW